jgi:hypothetical protein
MTQSEGPIGGGDESIIKIVIYRELSELQTVLEEPPYDIAKMLQIAFLVKQEARGVSNEIKKLADDLYDEIEKYKDRMTQNANVQLPPSIKNIMNQLFESVM